MSEEEKITDLEAQFPMSSGVAFENARKEALESGLSVLQSEDGVIYEIFPDGSRRRVKEIEPPTAVTPGLKLRIG